MYSAEERAAMIARIAALPDELEALVGGLPPAQLGARGAPDEWTVAQIVHHLADAHMNAFVRVKLILTEEQPTFKPYDQVAWAATPDANSADLGPSLQVVRGLHTRWAQLLASLDEAQWQRTGWHPDNRKTYTPADILRTYSRHGDDHLDQIRRALAAA
jgi:hypothetical protein